MRFKVSDRSAVQVKDASAALDFYGGVLGLPASEEDGVPAVAAGPLTLYVDQTDLGTGIILELCVADVEAARIYLTERGCKVLRWEGVGNACLIEDPFGIRFNLWQEVLAD